jgi:hypothetical protein
MSGTLTGARGETDVLIGVSYENRNQWDPRDPRDPRAQCAYLSEMAGTRPAMTKTFDE